MTATNNTPLDAQQLLRLLCRAALLPDGDFPAGLARELAALQGVAEARFTTDLPLPDAAQDAR